MYRLIIPVFFLCLSFQAVSQRASEIYTFSQNSWTAYSSIESQGGIPLGETSSGSGIYDPLPIGFEFRMYDHIESYLQVYKNGWGHLSDGNATAGTLLSEDLNRSATETRTVLYPILAPFWDNNITSVENIYYLLAGVEGERRLTVEWKNVSWGSEATKMSFQIVLSEADDKISFHYSNTTSAQPVSGMIGISNVRTSGLEAADFLSISSDSPGTTSTGTEINNSNKPVNQQLFNITPANLFTQAQTWTGMYSGDAQWVDYDHDGDLDLFHVGLREEYNGSIGSYQDVGRTYMYRNDGGAFTTVNAVTLGLQDFSRGKIDFGDYNNDGYMDLLMANSIFTNDQDGTFTQLASFSMTPGSYSVVRWIDVDNDGDLDVYYTGSSSRGIKINQDTLFSDPIALPGDRIYLGDSKVGDLDNDGDLDILETGYSSTGTYVFQALINDGSGGFTLVEDIGIGIRYSSVALADFDNDGDLDILAGGQRSNGPSLAVYENLSTDGQLEFVLRTELSSAYGVTQAGVDVGDYNNDGLTDFFVTGRRNSSYEQIAFYFQNEGDFEFKDKYQEIGVADGAVASADYDGDGDLDVFFMGKRDLSASTTYRYSRLMKNLMNGPDYTFEAPQNLDETYDLENEVLELSWSPVQNFSNPDARATYEVFIGYTASTPDVRSPFIDINAGKLRATKEVYVQDTVFRLKGLQDSTYYWAVAAVNAAQQVSPYAHDSFTFGKPEAPAKTLAKVTSFTTTEKEFVVSWSPGKGAEHYLVDLEKDKNFDGLDEMDGEREDFHLTGFMTTDTALVINRDAIDSLTLDVGTYYFQVTSVNDFGESEEKTAIDSISFFGIAADTLLFTNVSSGDHTWLDVDNDSDLDLIMSGENSLGVPVLELYENVAGALLKSDFTFSEGYMNSSIALEDFDGNGFLDFVISGNTSSGVPAWSSRIYLNTTENSFQAMDPQFVALAYPNLEIADMDNDGDRDVVIHGMDNTNSYYVYVYTKNTDGSFALHQQLDGLEEGSMVVADLDNDADTDILITGIQGSPVMWLYINEAGTFGAAYEVPVNSPSSGGELALIDFDLDGDLDVINSGNTGLGAVFQVLVNESVSESEQLSFSEGQLFDEALYSSSIAVGDYNNDGYPDLLISGLLTDNDQTTAVTRLYKNSEGAEFILDDEVNALASISGGAVSMADYDQDEAGDLDFLVTGKTSTGLNAVKIYSNNLNFSSQPIAEPEVLTSTKDKSTILLTWQGTEGLSYDLFLKNKITGFVHSSAIAERAGLRKVAETGKLQTNHYRLENLPNGEYEWYVQSVNWAGSGSAQNGLGEFQIMDSLKVTPVAAEYPAELLLKDTNDILLFGFKVAGKTGGEYITLDSIEIESTAILDSYFSEVRVYRSDDDTWDDDDDLVATAIDLSLDSLVFTTVDTITDTDGIYFFLKADIASSPANGNIQFSIADQNLYINRGGVVSGIVDSPVYQISGNDFISYLDEEVFIALADGDAKWADFDNDGRFDLFLAGRDADDNKTATVYFNKEDGFDKVSLIGLDFCKAVTRDFDNDGYIDILLTGLNTMQEPVTLLYKNQNGTFSVLDKDVMGASDGTIEWQDFDGDGDLDIFFAGLADDENISRMYVNNNGTYSEIDSLNDLSALRSSYSVSGDIDSDGDIDIIVGGMVSPGVNAVFIYRNNNNTGFTVEIASGLPQVSGGDIELIDINGDDYLDVIISGINNVSVPLTAVYTGSGSGYSSNVTLSTATYGSLVVGDVNNDQLADILFTASDYTHIYIQDGGAFVEAFNEEVAGSGSANLALADYDGDKDLDIFVMDESMARLYDNLNDPSGLSAPVWDESAILDAVEEGKSIRLTWSEDAVDAQSYQVYITSGADTVKSAQANISSGSRKISERGEVTGNELLVSNLPAGAYSWGVQAINSAYEGSAFVTSPEPFIIPDTTSFVNNSGVVKTLLKSGSENETIFSFGIRSSGEVFIDSLVLQTSFSLKDTLDNIQLFVEQQAEDVSFDITDSTLVLYDLSVALTDAYQYLFIKANIGNVTQSTDTLVIGLTEKNIFLDAGIVVPDSIVTPKITFTEFEFSPTNLGELDSLALGDVVLADFDNDGDLDIFSSGKDKTGSERSILYENVNGSFSNSTPVSLASASLVAGDIDLDGNIDLAYSDVSISGYLHEADFATNTPFTTNLKEGAIEAGDLDNDGDLEIIYAGLDETSGKLKTIVEGYNYASDSIRIDSLMSGAIALGDIDNDGDLDIFITGQNEDEDFRAHIYINQGDSTGFTLSAGSQLVGLIHAAADFGDFDADGDLDLVVMGYDGEKDSTIIYQNHDGNLIPLENHALPALSYGDLKWVDLNNDDYLDIVISGYNHSAAAVISAIYMNDQVGGFELSSENQLPALFHSSIAVGDIDNDNDLDIVFSGWDKDSVAVTTLIRNVLDQGSPSIVTAPSELSVADTASINGVVLTWNEVFGAYGYNLQVTDLDGNLVRSAEADLETGYMRNPELKLIHNDSLIIRDLASAGAYQWRVQSVNTAGQGSAFSQQEYFYFGQPEVIQSAPATAISLTMFQANWTGLKGIKTYVLDVAKDEAFTDLLIDSLIVEDTLHFVSNEEISSGDTLYYRVRALNAFGISPEYSEPEEVILNKELNEIYSVDGVTEGFTDWADFDGDGDLDLLISGKTALGSMVRIYENDGVEMKEVASFAGLEKSVGKWADLDNDGDPDFVISGYTGAQGVIYAYRNDAGNFIRSSSYGNLYDGGLTVGDINNDGFVDVIVSGTSNGTASGANVLILTNTGDGQFDVDELSLDLKFYGGGTLLSDYDADGVLELIATGLSSDGTVLPVTIFENGNGSFTIARTLETGYVNGQVQAIKQGQQMKYLFSGLDEEGKEVVDLINFSVDNITSVYTSEDVINGETANRVLIATGDLTKNGEFDFVLNAQDTVLIYSANETDNFAVVSQFSDLLDLFSMAGGNNISLADVDGDGDLDISLIGLDALDVPTTVILKNNLEIPVPAIELPTELTITHEENKTIIGWDDEFDASYNVFVGTAEGAQDVVSSGSVLTNGNRLFTGPGNAATNKFVLYDLPNGTYTIGVQSLGPDYRASAFTTSTFSIADTLVVDQQTHYVAPLYEGTANVELMNISLGLDSDEPSTSITVSEIRFTSWVNPNELFDNLKVVVSSVGNEDRNIVPVVSGGAGEFVTSVQQADTIYQEEVTYILYGDVKSSLSGIDTVQFVLNPSAITLNRGVVSMPEDELVSQSLIISGNELTAYPVGQLPGLSMGDVSWIDYDQDGDYDLLLTGWDGGQRVTAFYENDSILTLRNIGDIDSVSNSTAVWEDINGDGLMDLVLSGMKDDDDYITSVFINNGEQFEPGQSLQGMHTGHIHFSDYDNDGDRDLLVTGTSSAGDTTEVYNNDKGIFSLTEIKLPALSNGHITSGDYDQDGDYDLLLVGDGFSALYTNLGGWYDRNEDVELATVSSGISAFADVDQDGDLDVIISGVNGGNYTALIYENIDGSFTSKPGFEGVANGDLVVTDINNDGAIELILSGENAAGPVTHVYTYSNGNFAPAVYNGQLAGLKHSAIAVAGFDEDADMDLVISGEDKDGVSKTYFYKNFGQFGNQAPDTPGTFEVSSQDGDVIFSWGAATDFETASVEYSVYAGSAPGQQNIIAGGADLENGKLFYPEQILTTDTFFILKNLHVGDELYWSVQAVDKNLGTSGFANVQHTIIPDSAVLMPFPMADSTLFVSQQDVAILNFGLKLNTADGAAMTLDSMLIRGSQSLQDKFTNFRLLYGSTNDLEATTDTVYADRFASAGGHIYGRHLNINMTGEIIYFFVVADVSDAVSDITDMTRLFISSKEIFFTSGVGFDTDTTWSGNYSFSNGTVAFYDLDGNGADILGNNNISQYEVLDTLDRYGKPEKAAWFNGSSFLQTPITDIGTEGSITAWVKVPEFNETKTVIGQELDASSSTFNMGILHADGSFEFKLKDNVSTKSVRSNGGLSPHKWYFLAMTWESGGEMQAFIDGEPVGAVNVDNFSGSSTSKIEIGFRNLIQGSLSYFEGIIDQVGLYSQVLTSEQIGALYQQDGWPRVFIDEMPVNSSITLLKSGKQDVELLGFSLHASSQVLLDSLSFSTPQDPAYNFQNLRLVKSGDEDYLTGEDNEIIGQEPVVKGLGVAFNELDEVIFLDTAYYYLVGDVIPAEIDPSYTTSFVLSDINFDFSKGGTVEGEVVSKDFTFTGTDFEGLMWSMPGFSSVESDFGDSDNDGDLDLVLTGFREGLPVTEIYRWNEEQTEYENAGISLEATAGNQVEWVDLFNSGRLDILLNTQDGLKIYGNTDTGFNLLSAGIEPLTNGSFACRDINRDGLQDIVTMGQDDNDPVFRVYINDGVGFVLRQQLAGLTGGEVHLIDIDQDEVAEIFVTGYNGLEAEIRVFELQDDKFNPVGIAGITPLNNSSFYFLDVDNSGTLEILYTGDDGEQIYSDFYAYDAGSFAYLEHLSLEYPVTKSSLRSGDIDGDGDIDLLITGDSSLIATNPGFTQYYQNEGNSFVLRNLNDFRHVSRGTVSLADIDGDQDLDVFVAGRNEGSALAKFYQNNLQVDNKPPAAVSGLVSGREDSFMLLQWDRSSDLETPDDLLTYDVVIWNEAGEYVTPVYAAENGVRKVVRKGLVPTNEYRIGNLPNDTYYWRVQAIDGQMTGGMFSEVDTFAVSDTIRAFNHSTDLVKGKILAGSYGVPVLAMHLQGTSGFELNKLAVTTSTDLSEVVDNVYLIYSEDSRLATYHDNDTISINPATITSEQILFDGLFRSLPGIADVYLYVVVDFNDNLNSSFNLSLNEAGMETKNGIVRIEENIQSAQYAVTSDLFELSQSLTGIENGQIKLADFDNDGDLDLLTADGSLVRQFRNNNGVFLSITNFGFGVEHAAIEIFDYDNDEDLDILIAGTRSINSAAYTGLFSNTNGTFTGVASGAFAAFSEASIASGDLDNDGDKDLVITGLTGGLFETHVYFNVNNNFVKSETIELIAPQEASVSLGDLNADGYLDIVIIGVENAVYFGNGSNFEHQDQFLLNLVSQPDVHLVDWDGDGFLNIVYSGIDQRDNVPVIDIYNLNGNHVGLELNDESDDPVRPAIQVFDYDNNGTQDILVMYGAGTYIIKNDPSVNLNDAETIEIPDSNLFNQDLTVGDVDNDGDLDLLVGGVDAGSVARTYIYRNNGNVANSLPTVPANLTATYAGGAVTFGWDESTDPNSTVGGITYEVLVTDGAGNYLVTSGSDAETGYRKIPQQGVIQSNTWSMDFSSEVNKAFTWKVQAIDGTYRGSAFAEGVIVVADTLSAKESSDGLTTSIIQGGSRDNALLGVSIGVLDVNTLTSLRVNFSADIADYLDPASLRLYQSSDSRFDGTDVESRLGYGTVEGNTVVFSGLNEPISTSLRHLFVVADAAYTSDSEASFTLSIDESAIGLVHDEFVYKGAVEIVSKAYSLEDATVSVEKMTNGLDDIPLQSESPNNAVFGIKITPSAPITLNKLELAISRELEDDLTQWRLYTSVDEIFNPATDTQLGQFEVGSDLMSIDGLGIAIAQYETRRLYVVADVGQVSSQTPSVTLSLSETGITLQEMEVAPFSISSDPLTFYLDNQKPEIDITPAKLEVARNGSIQVGIAVSDNGGVSTVKLYYRSFEDGVLEEVDLSPTGLVTFYQNTYTFDSNHFGMAGLEFYVEATDIDNNKKVSQIYPISVSIPFSAMLEIPETTIGLGTKAADYRIVSLPFQSERFIDVFNEFEEIAGDVSPLASSLGLVDQNQVRNWRIEKWIASQQDYESQELFNSFEPGEGYLVLTRKAVKVQVENVTTVSATSGNPHFIRVREGWNLIGNPYFKTLTYEQIKAYNRAVNPSLSDTDFGEMITWNGSWNAATSLKEYEGAFLYVNTTFDLYFPLSDELPVTEEDGGRIDQGTRFADWRSEFEENNWRLKVEVKQGRMGYNIAGIGINANASVDFDNYDLKSPPPIGNIVELYTTDSEGIAITSSIIDPGQTLSWTYNMKLPGDEEATIAWDNAELSQLSNRLYLIDPVQVEIVDMSVFSAYKVSGRKGHSELMFFYGSEDDLKKFMTKLQPVVGSIYPNPANHVFHYKAFITEESSVEVAVYDAMGRLVQSHREAMSDPGVYRPHVDLKPGLPKGMYQVLITISGSKHRILNKQSLIIK